MSGLNDSNSTSIRDNALVELVGADGTSIGNASDGIKVNLRNDAGTETGTSGTPLRVDPTGSTTQPISAASLPLPIGAATDTNQSTQIISLQILDDVPSSMNASFVKGSPMMGQLDDASTVIATENNVAPIRITANRAAHINFRDSSGSELGTLTNPISVTSSVGIINQLGTNTYSCAFAGNAAASGTRNPIILFKNPNASGKTAYIWKIIASGSSIANVSVDFYIYSSPTITTNGTAISTHEKNVGYGQAASVITPFSLPTVSSNGNLLSFWNTGQNSMAIMPEPEFSLGIMPNNSILLAADPSSNNRRVGFTIIWKEI